MTESLDAIVVGAGSAGLAAVREIGKRTERFLLVNDGPYGTTCARVGCMPSKVLIEAANAFHKRVVFDEMGIRGAAGLSADLPAVLARVRALRDDFVAGTLKLTDRLGERSIAGRARLLAPDRIEVAGREYRARSIVLATGSSPVVPKPWRELGDRILTTDTLFEQQSLPPRIAVVGLGAIGVEIAQALSRLGIQVSAFDAADRLAGLSDPEVEEALREALGREFPVRTGVAVELAAAGDGVEVRAGDARIVVDKVLAAVGRRPNLGGLGLEALGVKLDDRGMPPVDPGTMRIGDLPVFLAGDANGDRALLHEAADEGHIAGLNAVSPEPLCFERRTPMGVVFCDPNLATVGARFDQLDEASAIVGEADFRRQSRARMTGRDRGIARVYADRASGRLLGAAMCVPGGEHMAHLLALAVGQGLTVADMLRMPVYHPVLEEGLRGAFRALAKQLPDGGVSDLSACGGFQAEALD
ncbi:dihydrolipoyl dehydrogenase [Burkholderiaceae bacterium FT117]|uniref:dihydrolipoyl dehydrogenase n=1 Tax=Zeimonas sediminis TaxID=2944268 RepID=UPI002343109E|nr:dihydrolipoyl dehydrogenase [Zeimonas sediminis]MCM5570100.1 dihydrolipoyl dehydrogenase [Zeimonas sediminis]